MSQVQVKGIAEKMQEQGWEDAVNGNPPRFSTKNYMEGYNQGQQDMGENE